MARPACESNAGWPERKKTQLGQGLHGYHLGKLRKVERPVYDGFADRRVMKLRRNRVTGCGADMENRTGRRAHSDQGVRWPKRETHRPGCPIFRTGIGGAVLDPSTGSRSGKALIPRGTPSGEQGSIRQVAPGRGWTLQVSKAGNTGKSQKLRQLSLEQPSGWKAPDGQIGPPRPNSLLRCDNNATGAGWSLVPPQSEGEDAAQPPPQQRPVPLHLHPIQVLGTLPDLIPPAEAVPGVRRRGQRQLVLLDDGDLQL